MTIKIDVNEQRYFDVLMNSLTGIDDTYTLYYDETNNIRRLHVRPEGLNVENPQCFVLGGVGHRGEARDLGIADLRRELRIQPSAEEIKFGLIAHGEFHKLIGSQKLTGFLQWVLDRDLFIHYFALDPLYWSMVDIIDSIAGEFANGQMLAYGALLKNDLYTVLRHDTRWTVDFYHRYSYPDVGADRRTDFARELLDRLAECEDLLPHMNYQMLRGLLQAAGTVDSLPFLENETPNVLIDEFGGFFLKRISLFKTSQHILDVEEVIKAKFCEYSFEDHGRALDIHHFVDSKAEPGVQISDVVAGLLGKVFTFVNTNDLASLQDFKASLSSSQTANLQLLSRLLDRSDEISAAFIHRVTSIEDQRRWAFLLEDSII